MFRAAIIVAAIGICPACGSSGSGDPDGAGAQGDASAVDAGGDAAPASCAPDAYEEDDNFGAARVPDFSQPGVDVVRYQDNTLCLGDEDWVYVYLFSGETIEIQVLFQQASAAEDLDVLVYTDMGEGPTLQTVCSEEMPDGCRDDKGQSRDSNEEFTWTADSTGDHYFVIRGWMSSENDYQLCLALYGASCDPA